MPEERLKKIANKIFENAQNALDEEDVDSLLSALGKTETLSNKLSNMINGLPDEEDCDE